VGPAQATGNDAPRVTHERPGTDTLEDSSGLTEPSNRVDMPETPGVRRSESLPVEGAHPGSTTDGAIGGTNTGSSVKVVPGGPRPPAENHDRAGLVSRLRRSLHAVGRQPGAWIVAVLLTGALGQIEAHTFDPIVRSMASVFREVTGQKSLGAPDQQMNEIAGDARQRGYTITATSVGFAFGPRAEVMVLAPTNPANAQRSAELRVYAIPTKGRVQELFDFRPQAVDPPPTRSASNPLARAFTPRTFGISVRSIGRFDGSPGLQVLLDLYDPREPSIEVMPFLLSQNLTNDRFSLEPLLSPATTGNASITSILSTHFLSHNDWAAVARTLLYGRPIEIRNKDEPDAAMVSFAVSGYAVSTAAPFNTNGGVLTLAAGYAVRGGNFPTPTVMQILVWHVDLTETPPTARTFSGIPDFAPLPPSATSGQIQTALNLAAQGLPPVVPRTAH
jgi:hypothetical protein